MSRLDTTVISLIAAWGRASLRGEVDASTALPVYRTLRVCSFEREGHVWSDCASWFEELRAGGREPALGATLELETWREGTAEIYTSSLDLVAGTKPPRFDMALRMSRTRQVTSEPSVVDATRALDQSLAELVELGARADLGGWANHFAGILRVLRDEGAPEKDELPPSTPADVRRLAQAAARSDVFGGMGSWNDFALDDSLLEHERGALSSNLWDAFRVAWRAAINAI